MAVRTVSNPDKLARLNRELDEAREADQVRSGAGAASQEANGYEPEPAPGDLR